MILKGFKEKSNKNYINYRLKNRVVVQPNAKVKRVGVLFNADEISEIPSFKSLAKVLGIEAKDITIVAFQHNVAKDKDVFKPTFTVKHLGWKGAIKNEELKQFLNTTFDMLISYYKANETALKLFTTTSKAQFKVGILENDERINDLIIKTKPSDFNTFKSELIKYLTILNKI